nr:EAL domain-containing protein [Pararoseomonas baculiformis]
MARLVGPHRPPLGLLCEPQPDAPAWSSFQAAAQDPFSPTQLLLLGQGQPIPPDPAALVIALRALTGRHEGNDARDAAALRRGLEEGEVALRYQPIVRIADRAPAGLEGLVRWLRPDGHQGTTPLGPDAFVPMAERSGLGPALTRAVAQMAAADMAALRPGLSLPVCINMPLQVVLRRDTLTWLRQLARAARLRPAFLGVELTETTPVRDPAPLLRAVTRLREAGHAVWIDDMSLEENRDLLLGLPFTGLKLDRFLVGAMPGSRRARAEVERLVAAAHARGMLVTAEGVTGARLWRAVAMAGVDRAQGFAVGRPLPAQALPAWLQAWRAERRIAPEAVG